ncbi:MAG: nuclear transport factor 2 family protein [Alphaproteobacteria bacterium]|nr:nuclear transport factor 2 family protein [Alphaproteobacteria bacterium]
MSDLTAAWLDKLAIGEVVQNWALWRDTGNWDGLRRAFHPDGTMTATWFAGGVADFIAGCQRSWAAGSRSAHFIGGTVVELNGAKALAESRIILMVRDTVDDVEVDVTCYGRFYDRFVKLDKAWRILQRGVVYEKDRLDPVRPDAKLTLDDAILKRFPEGYRHVAYVQTKRGLKVAADRPTPRSAELESLYRDAQAWLAG